jgi:hypothetical protein
MLSNRVRMWACLPPVVAVMLSACRDAAPGPLAPDPGQARTAMVTTKAPAHAAAAASLHHVSGSAYIDLSVYGGGREMYSFNATLDAAGRASGFFNSEYAYEFDVPGGFRYRADVVCLAVAGRDAWLGLRVVRSQDPAFLPVGTEAVVRVRDAGEGRHVGEPEDADDTIDQNYDGIGYVVFGEPAANCTQKLTVREFWVLWWLDAGNIQVR